MQSGLSKAQKRITSFSEGVESRLGSISTDRLSRGLSNIDASAVPAAQSVQLMGRSFGKVRGKLAGTTNAVINFNRIIQDAPFGIIGVANNLEPMIQSFNQLKATSGSTTKALKTLLTSALTGPGALITAVSVASSLLLVFSMRMRGSKKEAEELTDAMDNLNSSWEKTIDLQEQFDAFDDDEFGIAKTGAQIREITEDIEEQQQALREVNSLQVRQRELKLKLLQEGLTDQQQAELDNINRQINAYADAEQIQLRIDDLMDRRQRLSEDLVKTSEALSDEDTKSAQSAQDAKEAREQELAIMKQMEERIDPIAMGFTEWERRTDEADKNIKAISVSLENMPSVSDKFKEEDFPVGTIGAMEQELQILQAALQRVQPGSESFKALAKEIGLTEEELEKAKKATDEIADEGVKGIDTLTMGFGRLTGAIISGKKEALSFSNIMSAILPGLLNVLFPGGGALGGVFKGLFGGIFHDGGVVPGPLGKERLILAQGGETVMTPQQMRQGMGGRVNVHITGELRQRGTDLVAVINQTTQGTLR